MEEHKENQSNDSQNGGVTSKSKSNRRHKYKGHKQNLQSHTASQSVNEDGANLSNQAQDKVQKPNQAANRPRKNPSNTAQNAKAKPTANDAIKPDGAAKNSEEKAKKRRKHTKNKLPTSLTGSEDWHKAMQASISANEAMHEVRLHPLKYFNDTNKTIRITPLGGLGEVGANMTVFETNTSAIIVDVGMSFPDDNMPGVDILIPDFDYIRKIKDKVKGIFITHAHEDHIGAMPYFFKEFQFPVYGTALPLGMISNKFEEHGLKAERSYFRPIQKRKIYEVGDFKVEFIHITHSVIDASALAITTEAGTIIHTGDFKIDHTPIDGFPTDISRLAQYGEKGVLLLLSDSTNSHKEGFTKSESTVGKTFDELFSRSKGRVIMSTFSSNLHRIYQAIECGLKYNRKVCVIGRSMERNLFTAMELGYIKLDKKIFIDPEEVCKYPDGDILIVTTGSQGETMSALYRMATDEHKYIKITPNDTVIISAKAIPGNENSVSTVINYILKSGAKVAYQDFSEIHVSGHAAQEEQKLMIRLTKPKFFLPVHGEYNMIVRHKETAMSCGIDERNMLLMSDGDQIEVCGKYMKRVKTVKTGKVFIDNQINKQIADDVVLDRQNLADAGVAVIIAHIDKRAKKLIKTRVTSYGLVANKQDATFTKDMENVLEQFLANVKNELLTEQRMLENQIRQVVRKHIFRKLKKYPTIVPVIYLM